MRPLLAIVIVTAFVAVGTAAEDVVIAPRFLAGSELSLEIKDSLRDSTRPEGDYTATMPVRVRILSATAARVELEWSPGEVKVAGTPSGPDLGAVLVMQAGANIAFRLELDERRRFRAFSISDDTQSKVDAALAKLISQLPDRPDSRMSREELVKRLFSSRVFETAAHAAQVYTEINGLTAAVGQSLQTDVTIPASADLRIAGKYVVQLESATDALANVTTHRAPTIAGLKTLTDSFPAQVAFTLSEDGKYVFDRKLNLMREATWSVHATRGTDERENRETITASPVQR